MRLGIQLEIELVLCGVLLAGLTVLARHFQPDLPGLTVYGGLVGGGLCVLCGALRRATKVGLRSAMVTLTLLVCVFMLQAVQSWVASPEGDSKARTVAALMTMLVAFCGVTLANLATCSRRG